MTCNLPKKQETYFSAQCVVWIILLYWPQKNQLLQHCQVVFPVVQKDPEIPKFMTGSQKAIPELTGAESEGICTMEPRAPRTSLQPGLPEFSSTLLHGLVLFCRDPETQISTAVTSWLWVWRDTLQQTLKWIREPVYYSGEVAREPTYLNSFQ